MSDKNKTDPTEFPEPDRFAELSDEQLMELVKAEGGKDASVLAKLIIIQRIRKGMLNERKWLRYATVASIVLACIALYVGISGKVAFDNFMDDRDERTVTACEDAREDAIAHNTAIEEQVRSLYFIESLSIDPHNQPQEAAFLRVQMDGRIEEIRKNYQVVRKCSNQAIDDYNNTEGKLGIEKEPFVDLAERVEAVPLPPDVLEEAERAFAEEQAASQARVPANS